MMVLYTVEGHPSQRKAVAKTPREALQNLLDRAKGMQSLKVLVWDGIKLVATIETDQFGNPTIQFLQSEVYDIDSTVVSQRWEQYGINGLGEILRLNADRYVRQGE
jgi:hypothetical protein